MDESQDGKIVITRKMELINSVSRWVSSHSVQGISHKEELHWSLTIVLEAPGNFRLHVLINDYLMFEEERGKVKNKGISKVITK